jgi:hypothetical protein
MFDLMKSYARAAHEASRCVEKNSLIIHIYTSSEKRKALLCPGIDWCVRAEEHVVDLDYWNVLCRRYVCVRCLEGLHVPVFHGRVTGSAVCSTSIKSETHRNFMNGLGKDTTQGGCRMEQHLE